MPLLRGHGRDVDRVQGARADVEARHAVAMRVDNPDGLAGLVNSVGTELLVPA